LTTIPQPIISVITPTKNRLKLLKETMDSVLAQTFEAWEHLIIDDGSDDGTTEEVTKRAVADSRIRYIRRNGECPGANVCRNLGVHLSNSELIVFLDSDDLLAPHCLKQRTDVLLRNTDLDFAVFPGFVFKDIIGDDSRLFSPMTLGSDLDRFLYLDHPWEITGPIWRRTALERIGLFVEYLPSWQDVELHVRALTAGARYVKCSLPDHYIRWQSEPTKVSVLQFTAPIHLDKGLEIVGIFHSELSKTGLLNWYRRRALGGLIFLLAERWVKNESLVKALRVWSSAFHSGFAPLLVYIVGGGLLILRKMQIFDDQHSQRLLERFRLAVGFRA
jgi:glycosyltransferase involved in cell wall biosynthesis